MVTTSLSSRRLPSGGQVAAAHPHQGIDITARTTMTTSDSKAHFSFEVIGGLPQSGHLPATLFFPHRGHETRMVTPANLSIGVHPSVPNESVTIPTVEHEACASSITQLVIFPRLFPRAYAALGETEKGGRAISAPFFQLVAAPV